MVRFGRSTKSLQRHELTPEEEQERLEAKRTLQYPPVQFTGLQARGIGQAFAWLCRKRGYTIWAASILPEHTHLVIARHTYNVEHIVNLLKGEATRQLVVDNLHPLRQYARPGERPPKMWASGFGRSTWTTKKPCKTPSGMWRRIPSRKANRHRSGRALHRSADSIPDG